MFRRSRFSVRPNVGTAGRTAAASQEAPPVTQESSDTAKDVAPSNTDTAAADKPVPPSENPAAQGDGSDQTGDGNASSAALQRRKRFSVKPKVLPGRPSVLARTAKSPVKAAKSPAKSSHETVVEVPEKAKDVPGKDSQRVAAAAAAAAPQGLQSPRRQRPSEHSQQPKVQAQPNLVPSDSSAEDSQKQSQRLTDAGTQLEPTSDCQGKESHFKVPEKVPPSLPNKDTAEISEKAKTLVSSKLRRPPSASAFSLSRLLNDPSDLHRLAKARKLRELLKEEIHKEKRLKKSKLRSKEFTLDPAKMTMRDLIHYLPESNPMSSSLEVAPEDETVVPPLPEREDPLERAQEPAGSQREEEEEEEAADGEQEEALLVPQVKVAEDGTLIIDESSLTVEVQRAKGPNVIQDRDPIFERGSTTTYSSFRKGNYSKPWSVEETDMFFLAVSMVGTDFTMICQLFPHRARSEIKNKFKKEERQNSWRIDKAFRERRKLDIEYFSKLLEMILEYQKTRKKHKALVEKNEPKKKSRRAKGKKAQQKLSDVEEEEEEEELPDLEDDDEEVGEEENEDLCSESQAPLSQPRKQRKRRREQDAPTAAPEEGTADLRDSSQQDQVSIPEHAEAAHLEDDATPDRWRSVTDPAAAKHAPVKPDPPPPGGAARPRATLTQTCAETPPPPSSSGQNDTCAVTGTDGTTEEQASHDANLQQCMKRKLADDDDDDDVSSEEEAQSPPLKPTRYGRMPKPTKPLNYPSKEDTHPPPSSSSTHSEAASAPTTGPSAPRPRSKCPAKRRGKAPSVPEPKRPKLITLRASQSEYSDDDEDESQEWAGPGQQQQQQQQQQLGCTSSSDGAAAFVPASLCSLHPVSVEVEETMEELDIFASMPDVLGISQDALCSDVKTAENETCSAAAREHQLDLLVDVIDCLPSECTVSEVDSYNEAAQTLLTIGNLAHGAQSPESQSAVEDQAEVISSEERHLETHQAAASSSENSDVSLQGSADSSCPNGGALAPASDQKTEKTPPSPPPPPQLASPEKAGKVSTQTRRSRISQIKPNPVLRQSSKPLRSTTQAEAVKGSEEITAPAPSSSQTSQIPPAAEVKKTGLSQRLSSETREDEVPEADGTPTPGRTSEDTDSASDQPAGRVSGSEVNTLKDSAVPQTRRGRFQKAKPNLPARARPACSRSRTAQDSKSTPGPPQESAGTDVSPPGKNQDLGLDSSEKKTGPADLIASDSERQQEDTREVISMSESTEGQTDSLGGAVEPPPVQETSHHPASGDPGTQAPAVCPREETASTPARPVRRNRFQKVKPKPNLPSTPRSVRGNAVDASCHPSSTPRSHGEAVGEAPQITAPGKVEERAAPGSVAVATPEATVTEAEQSDVGVEGETEPSVVSKDRPVQPEEQRTNPPAPTPRTGPGLSAGGLEPGSAMTSPPVPESPHPPVSQEGGALTCQTRKDGRVQHKPNPLQTSRAVRSTPRSTEEPVERPSGPGSDPRRVSAPQKDQTAPAHAPSQGPETSATSGPSSPAEGQGENAGSSESAARNEPQKRQRFPKAKPNLGSSARNLPAKPHPSNARKASERAPQQDGDPSTSTEMSRDGRKNEAAISPRVAIAIQAVAAGTESKAPASGDAADICEGRSSENVPAEPDVKSVSVDPSSERPQQACSEGTFRGSGSAERAEDGSLAQSTLAGQSDPGTSAKPAGKVLARRGRLVKPKPNLGQNSRSKQIQQSAQTDGDSGGSGVQISQGRPVGGAVEQETANLCSDVADPLDQPRGDPDVAGSSVGCLSEATTYTQDLTTPSAAGSQIPADFTIFSEMLAGPVPADPDEPFFILSLTEIPVGSLGEVGDGASAPLPLLPVTELQQQQQQQSVPGECLGEPFAHVIVSSEESCLVPVGDLPLRPAASQLNPDSDLHNPLDPHESAPPEPPTSPEEERPSRSPAAKQPERKQRDGNASELPAPPPEPEGRLQNVSPGGGTVPRDSSVGAGTTHARTVAAPSDGSPCEERTRSAPEPAASTSRSAAKTAPAQQEAAPVPPPALPQQSEGDAEPMSHTEERERERRGPNGTQEEEPPTSVSQYFLSDIFTEVEEE